MAQKGVADFRETLDSDSGESDCRQNAKIFLVRMTKARTSPQPFSLYGQPTYDVESLIEIGCWQHLMLLHVTEYWLCPILGSLFVCQRMKVQGFASTLETKFGTCLELNVTSHTVFVLGIRSEKSRLLQHI